MSTTTPELKAAAVRAADWLEANPTKHIVGVVATTDDPAIEVSPNSDEATCFCAVGRLIREAGIDMPDPLDYSVFPDPVAFQRIFHRNDDERSDGIRALREYAA